MGLTMAGYPPIMGYFAGPCLPIGSVGKKMPAGIRRRRGQPEKVAKYGELRSCDAYLSEFKEALGDKPFFGGESPAATDVSLFATFQAFDTIPYPRRMLQKSGLSDWYSRVEAKMP